MPMLRTIGSLLYPELARDNLRDTIAVFEQRLAIIKVHQRKLGAAGLPLTSGRNL